MTKREHHRLAALFALAKKLHDRELPTDDEIVTVYEPKMFLLAQSPDLGPHQYFPGEN